MLYQKTDLSQEPKKIIKSLLNSEKSQLLIPPFLQTKSPIISSPQKDVIKIGLFSSGSTGKPKCIWNDLSNLKSNAVSTAKAFKIQKQHRLLIMAVPWHVAGISWAIMAEELGCEYEFIKTQKGEDKLWLENILDFQPDYLLTVPAVLRDVYDKDWFVSNVVFGGYPIPIHELNLLALHSEFMRQGFGQTEAGGLISSHEMKSSKSPKENEHLCCGKAIEGVELRCSGTVTNPKDIYIKSKTSFTKEWYNSRDLGYIDENSNLYLMGRKDEVLNKK